MNSRMVNRINATFIAKTIMPMIGSDSRIAKPKFLQSAKKVPKSPTAMEIK